MKIWIRRTAGVAALAGGLIAAGATAAQAAAPADTNYWDFGTYANSSAYSANQYSNTVTQSGGLANINYSPNYQYSAASSSALALPIDNTNVIFAH